jgi:hypothetical protein
MIVFELKCGREHRFEAWFSSGGAYDAQSAAGEISCPQCGSAEVAKAPMAPRLGRRQEEPAAPAPQMAATLSRDMMLKLRHEVEANCENVGERFAEEARKIHYGEVERRDIYGQASTDEATALAEEGVEFSSLPWPREDA